MNSHQRKLSHVSDQLLSQLQVPLILGNELFVVTQEDIRHVEDTRVLSYNRLMPNGELIPLDYASVETLIEVLNRTMMQRNNNNSSSFSPSSSILNNARIAPILNLNPSPPSFSGNNSLHWRGTNTVPMEVSTTSTNMLEPLMINKTTSTTNLEEVTNHDDSDQRRKRCVNFEIDNNNRCRGGEETRHCSCQGCSSCSSSSSSSNSPCREKQKVYYNTIGTNTTRENCVDHVTQTVHEFNEDDCSRKRCVDHDVTPSVLYLKEEDYSKEHCVDHDVTSSVHHLNEEDC